MFSKKKILISGYNIDGKTGYGNQTSQIIKAFKELDYYFALLSWDDSNNEYRRIIETNNYTNLISKYSLDKSIELNYNQWFEIEWAANYFKADFILFIHDIWFFKEKKDININFNINPYFISLYPLHKDPLDLNEFKIINDCDMILSMSKWENTILNKYHNNVYYFPNIISDIFIDNFVYDNKNIRKKINIPIDSYCFLIIGRNSENCDRKNFEKNLLLYSQFNERYPHKVHLYIHSYMDGAIKLKEIIDNFKITNYTFSDQEKILNNLYTDKELLEIYQSCDIVLHLSKTEGFGLCHLEAQACGVPVIVTQCSAMTEHVYLGDCVDGKLIKEEENIGSETFFDINYAFNLINMKYYLKKISYKEKNIAREIIGNTYNFNNMKNKIIEIFNIAEKAKNKKKLNHILGKNNYIDIDNKKIDAFMYNNEIEELKSRLLKYNDYVSYFILVESDRTFEYKEKFQMFEDIKNEKWLKDYIDKIVHVKVNLKEDYNREENKYYQLNGINIGINLLIERGVIKYNDILSISSNINITNAIKTTIFESLLLTPKIIFLLF
jgi:glycosyltransferase involved in cell wall biosynthesis